MDDAPKQPAIDSKKLNDQISSLSDSYIKFLFYHLIIIFTIVYSLFNAVNSRNNEEVKQMATEVRDLAKAQHIFPDYAIRDQQVKDLYFSSNELDTSVTLIPFKEALRNDTAIQAEQRAALLKMEEKLNTINSTIDKAYKVKLSFLGDVFVDLRSWIYFLPFVFLISCIYIFIHDYKIQALKKFALYNLVAVDFNSRYPYGFLRTIFLAIEGLLVFTYTFILFQYFEASDSNIKTLTICGYFSFIYYGIIYCVAVSEGINNSFNIPEFSLPVIVYLRKKRNKISKVLTKWNPFYLFSTGQLMILSTLLLPMSCSYNESTGQNHKYSGFDLVFTKATWFDNPPDSFIYKYLYIVAIIAAGLTFFYYSTKLMAKDKLKVRLLTTYGIAIPTVFFTMFFTATFLSDYVGDMDKYRYASKNTFVAGILVCFIGYFLFKKRAKPHLWTLTDLFIFIVFLLPPTLLALFICGTTLFDSLFRGWMPFYYSLWVLLFAIVLYNIKNQAAADNSS